MKAPDHGSAGVRLNRSDFDYGSLVYDPTKSQKVSASQFAQYHQRSVVPNRYSVKAKGKIVYRTNLSSAAQIKAKKQSANNPGVDYCVFDTMDPAKKRIARGRPGYLSRYRNGEYFIV